jgi:hypothetical protein
MATKTSKKARWTDAVRRAELALGKLEEGADSFQSAVNDLTDLQGEFSEEYENLSETQQESERGETLQTITELDLDFNLSCIDDLRDSFSPVTDIELT